MGSISRYKNAASRRIYHAVSTCYYDYLYGRKIPLDQQLNVLVNKWERTRLSGDTPLSQTDWDSQYRTGKWAGLAKLDELARYSIIVGYLRELKPNASILDVGSGEGLLFERFQANGYKRYVGIELSSVANEKLQRLQSANTTFLCADAETYMPQEDFDVIVFNEILYYFHDPLAVVERLTQTLVDDGVVIVSTYAQTPRGVAILRSLKSKYRLLDESHTTQGTKSWYCSVFASQ